MEAIILFVQQPFKVRSYAAKENILQTIVALQWLKKNLFYAGDKRKNLLQKAV